MKQRLLFGIFWRYLAWSTGAGLGIGVFLPSILLVAGVLIWGFLFSGLSPAAAIAGTEFGPLLLIMLISGLVGADVGIRMGVPVGIVNGLVVGLMSIGWFDPPLSERRYRLTMAVTVLVISMVAAIFGFQINVVDRYSGFYLWKYPTMIAVGIVAILVCDYVADWYLSNFNSDQKTAISLDEDISVQASRTSLREP